MSPQATFYFADELTEFLIPGRRTGVFRYTFENSPAIKHLVESLGVPHVEVAGLLVNGQPVDFFYRVQDGDRIEVEPFLPPDFPRSENPDQEPSPPEPRFILDTHLGKLAVYLRILGFDALYRNDYQDDELVREAVSEDRVLLTRDRRLLMRRILKQGYWVRSLDPSSQVNEVVIRFGLAGHIRPFQRCLRCNHLLQTISKEEILHRLEPLTRAYYDEFHLCPSCDHIYWKGSHYEHMLALVENLFENKE